MSETVVELLFFDTFAHDSTEEINLDLVQFPKPVYVTEVRIIPLGARVQADFPGGVRLGATNPSQFQIEFFVNDLGKPGASTFETLGSFEYDQNGKINLECTTEISNRKIPTDGLVLKGLYTTITLAVYGTLTKNLSDQLIQPIVNPTIPSQPNTIADSQQIVLGNTVEPEWPQECVPQQQIADFTSQATTNFQSYGHNPETYTQPQTEYTEYYGDTPKDPRSYHHSSEPEWDKSRSRESDRERGSRDVYQEREHNDRRDRRYSQSDSRDRERSKDYHESSRDRENYDRDHDRGDYRSERDRGEWEDRDRDRQHDRERGRDRRHDDGYRRSARYRDDREDRKRPRSPPTHQSPKQPHSPGISETNKDASAAIQVEPNEETSEKSRRESKEEKPVKKVDEDEPAKDVETPPVEEASLMDVEEFEPILSDEDILDDNDHYQDTEYDYTAYTNNDDIVRQFNPGVSQLKKYAPKETILITDGGIKIEENLKTTIGIVEDYFRSSITKYELDSFSQLNTEIKEEFVHLCEKFIGTIGDSATILNLIKVYDILKSSPPEENADLSNQTIFLIETICDWARIALNYDMANCQDQPAYKIRHIKCGVRLAELLSNSENFIAYLHNKNIVIHNELLDLYHRDFMALSIKLMILKALDTYLLHKFSVEQFFMDCGYKTIVEALQKNPLVREKFSLTSILKKLNLYEILSKMHSILSKLTNVSHDVSAEEINLITKSLNQILNYCNSDPFAMSQPKRFLPVASQFEIMRADTQNLLVHYFKIFHLLQCFILLLTCPSTLNLPAIKTPIFEIVSVLLETPEGLEYLSNNAEALNVLLKCLLRTDEEMQYSINENIELHSHNLGLKIAYKIQCLYHVECLLDVGSKAGFDCDSSEVIDELHNMFCLTFSSVGKFAVGEVLGMGDNIMCLLQFSENRKSLKQSPGIGYIIDLLYIPIVTVSNIKFLEKYLSKIREVVSWGEAKAIEINSYLSPLENLDNLNYDNISPLLNTIENHIEGVISNPGPSVTSLRILQHLGISNHDNKSSENPLYNYTELKYKHVILQLYSLDTVTVFVKLLQKLCNHFEQPGVHSSIFVSNQGIVLVNLIHPLLLLLKKMQGYVIQCRNTQFKDLTAVPVLLRTYNLLNSFPSSSSATALAQKCRVIIIEALMVYTQPVADEMHEKDSLSKTLWSQMVGEVIKFITTAPCTFVSGLLILSELLPLPLPVHTRDDLSKEEISWTINLRKLWSAHLHPHSGIIQDTVNKLCISTQPQLLNLLRRICVQVSDLAANSALMIARGFLDTVYNALMANEQKPCTSHIARLLNFLACLVTHSTIKCAILHMIQSNSNVTGKADEKYSSLIPAFSQILKLNDLLTSHIQSQECILSIIQSFCDAELSLLQTPLDGTSKLSSETYLANALPLKEHLQTFIGVILDHLGSENSFVTYLPIVRTLLLLTEHDYGFYHLRETLLKKDKLFLTMLNQLSRKFAKTSPELLSTLNTLIEFLRVCLTTEESDGNLLYSPRSITMSVEEVKNLVGWKPEEQDQHPFKLLEDTLKSETEEDNRFESILEGLTLFLKQLKGIDRVGTSKVPQEVILPTPEVLLTQYSCRIVFSSSDACDERLTDRYWLVIPTEEGEVELETVQCDLFEICRQLPPEFNLIKEVEKLCRISRTDPSNLDKAIKHDEEQRSKSRKPFITPMRPRGFPRSAPQRPDLFRSRPPNTSRPPSLHVDDFVALETCGAQPTGPTGYNKLSREILASTRMARGARGRAFVTSERSMQYNRQILWWGAAMGRSPYF
ncbi:protein virilizer [Euwallacea fornicatus]|uniref:protein virilizer n=1 Tax=Euwallacea fornicatus TaxID=995702 RepID=UPI00338E7850